MRATQPLAAKPRRRAQQHSEADTGQQHEAQQKLQQAPRRLIRNHTVDSRQCQRVDTQPTDQLGIGVARQRPGRKKAADPPTVASSRMSPSDQTVRRLTSTTPVAAGRNTKDGHEPILLPPAAANVRRSKHHRWVHASDRRRMTGTRPRPGWQPPARRPSASQIQHARRARAACLGIVSSDRDARPAAR